LLFISDFSRINRSYPPPLVIRNYILNGESDAPLIQKKYIQIKTPMVVWIENYIQSESVKMNPNTIKGYYQYLNKLKAFKTQFKSTLYYEDFERL
jgi:hypothetical protein